MRNRGRVCFFQGKFVTAREDFRAGLKLRPDNMRMAFWLYLANGRAGVDGRPDLASFVQNHAEDQGWIAPVLKLYLGVISPKQCLEAFAHHSLKMEKEEKCLGHFFVGQYYLTKGKYQEAKKSFAKCLDSEFILLNEFHGARVELERLAD